MMEEPPSKLLSFDDLIGLPSKLSNRHGIDSLQKFLDLKKSASFLNEITEYHTIRQNVLHKIVEKPVKGSDMYKEFKIKTKVMKTGWANFDDIFVSELHPLGSYLHWGDVVEICGECNSGKSQLIQQILITNDFYDIAYYIDTRLKFSATKLENMMVNLGFDVAQIGKILNKINVHRVNDLDTLYNSLHHINHNQDPNLKKIVVIDSISVLIGLYMGDTQMANALLADIMHEINKLTRCNSTFLISNLASYVEHPTRLNGEWKLFCGSFWSSFADHKVFIDEDGDCELYRSKHFSVGVEVGSDDMLNSEEVE